MPETLIEHQKLGLSHHVAHHKKVTGEGRNRRLVGRRSDRQKEQENKRYNCGSENIDRKRPTT